MQRTRRLFVKTVGTLGIPGLAGCAGNTGQATTTARTRTTGTTTAGARTDATDTAATRRSPTDTPTATRTGAGTTTPGRLDEVEYYFVNNAGTRLRSEDGGPFYRHGYRSVEPLRMETDAGGDVRSRDHTRGMKFEIDLADEDKFGEAGMMTVTRELDGISEIGFRLDGDLIVALQLGLEYNDGTIYEWESAGENRERTRDLDGDRAVLTDPLSGPSIRIGRDEQVFFDLGSERYRSIEGLVDEFGTVPVRTVATINGGTSPVSADRTSAETVLTSVNVDTA